MKVDAKGRFQRENFGKFTESALDTFRRHCLPDFHVGAKANGWPVGSQTKR